MRAWLALALALGGCNLVFGLEPGEGGGGDGGDGGDGGGDGGGNGDAGGGDGGQCSSTADEDGDGVPDDCDVCPHRSDAAQLDDDGDGVGNLCDPDPTLPNRIAFFDGFNTPGLPGWVQSPPTWTQAGGFAVQLDEQLLAAYLMRDGVTPEQALVDAALIAGPFASLASDPYRGASVFIHSDTVVVGAAPSGVECQFSTSLSDSSSSLYLQRWTNGTTQVLNASAVNDLFEVNGRYDIAMAASGDLYACSGGYDSPTPFATITAQVQPAQGGAIALRTRYTGARWAYVIVIDRSGSDAAR